MQTIRLPACIETLHSSDLRMLNQQLRRGEIRLDWSDVTSVGIAPKVLHTLFAGLHLADAIDDIGGDTIPESLVPEIQTAFVQGEEEDIALPLPASTVGTHVFST